MTSLSSSFPALQVHPPWVRCLESNPKTPSKGWSRYGYMARQGDSLAISNQDARTIRIQKGNTPSMRAYCARRVYNLRSWKPMDNLEWLVPPNHHMKVPLVSLNPSKSCCVECLVTLVNHLAVDPARLLPDGRHSDARATSNPLPAKHVGPLTYKVSF